MINSGQAEIYIKRTSFVDRTSADPDVAAANAGGLNQAFLLCKSGRAPAAGANTASRLPGEEGGLAGRIGEGGKLSSG